MGPGADDGDYVSSPMQVVVSTSDNYSYRIEFLFARAVLHAVSKKNSPTKRRTLFVLPVARRAAVRAIIGGIDWRLFDANVNAETVLDLISFAYVSSVTELLAISMGDRLGNYQDYDSSSDDGDDIDFNLILDSPHMLQQANADEPTVNEAVGRLCALAHANRVSYSESRHTTVSADIAVDGGIANTCPAALPYVSKITLVSSSSDCELIDEIVPSPRYRRQ